MRRLLSIVVNRAFFGYLGLVFLVAVVWYGGVYLDFSEKARMLVILGILVQVAIVLILRSIFASKNANRIESFLKKSVEEETSQGDPFQDENIAALKTKLIDALDSLKKSKLGKRGLFRWGNAALYELPWYIIVGPPASGKSTLLRNSTLSFPHIAASADKGVQGVGGTRNCDWWFSNDAIFLDTAGRWSVEDSDNDEWLGFLDLLKKYRKKKPVNGVLLSISISDLLEMSGPELEETARKLSGRIDELTNKLKIRFPLYVLFTKCDKLQGFVEFFENLSQKEREQVWGRTHRVEEIEKKDSTEMFKEDLDNLYCSLNQWRLTNIGNAINQNKRDKSFLFPLQFKAAQERVLEFLTILTVPNSYVEQPIFRGFYFTCGTQEGSPIDQVINKISETLTLPDVFTEPFKEEAKKNAFFIKRLFTEIIFPDQSTIRQISFSGFSGKLYLVASYLLPGLLSLGLILLFISSFKNNNFFLKKVGAHVLQVRSIQPDSRANFEQSLFALEKLRTDLETLNEYEQSGVPLNHGFGFYKGDGVNKPARAIYFRKLQELFLTPSKQFLEEELSKLSNERPTPSSKKWDQLFETLKTYLMLATPSKIESAFLQERLPLLWEKFVPGSNLNNTGHNSHGKSILSKQISFYLSQKNHIDLPALSPNDKIVKNAQSILNSIPLVKRLYSDLVRQANGGPSFKLNSLLNNEEKIIFSSSYSIPYVFTVEGWNSIIKNSFNKTWEHSSEDSWILGGIDSSKLSKEQKSKLILGVRKLYLTNYLKEWEKFFRSIKLVSFRNLDDALMKLDLLSDSASSPLKKIFIAIRNNLELEKKTEKGSESNIGNIISRRFGFDINTEEIASLNPLLKEYENIAKFSGTETGENSNANTPINQYLETLRKVYDQLRSIRDASEPGEIAMAALKKRLTTNVSEIDIGLKVTDSLLREFRSKLKRNVKRLLKAPYEYSIPTIIVTASSELNKRWENTISQPFAHSIKGKFPFIKPSLTFSDIPEASLLEVTDFFRPEDGIFWEFFKSEMEPLLRYKRNGIEGKRWGGSSLKLSPAFNNFYGKVKRITEALFPPGETQPRISYVLKPFPDTAISEVFVEIEGKRHTYTNSPIERPRFTWPVDTALHGARIGITVWKPGWDDEKSVQKKEASLWGFFKLLSQSKITQENDSNFKIRWDFTLDGGTTVPLKFQLHTDRSKSPFEKGIFNNLNCPKTITL